MTIKITIKTNNEIITPVIKTERYLNSKEIERKIKNYLISIGLTDNYEIIKVEIED
jgi:hypothetical protein